MTWTRGDNGEWKHLFLHGSDRKNSFSEGVVKLWNRLLLLVVESPSLNVQKMCKGAWGHGLVVDMAELGLWLGLVISEAFLNF